MKQVLQRLDYGTIELADVPMPSVAGPRLLVQSRVSLISAGTERMLLDFGRAGWLEKARQQPEKVRQVFDKVRTDGLATTLDAVRSKLGTPIALGYCNAGVVTEVGTRVPGFSAGDRVVTNGPHAEFVVAPHTLASRIPDGVSDDAAAFAPVAAIGLQGIRLAAPTLGETVVVYGLGLIGLLTVQLLRANGCRVIGIDNNPERLALAETFGAEPVAAEGSVSDAVLGATSGVGADVVLLTLASDSPEPIREAARMSRKRGRIVLVGVTDLSLNRDEFYKKELSFQVSCSYGPGRYDPSYEDQGHDYPLAFVRWTEQRNMDAVLRLMAEGSVDPSPLITARIRFAEAARAYDVLEQGGNIGIVLTYDETPSSSRVVPLSAPRGRAAHRTKAPTIGIIGAGNFAQRTIIPILRELRADIRTVVSPGGAAAAIAGKLGDAELAASQADAVLDDPAIDTVYVLTRHDSHASLALRALRAGKHVFVEKPLALDVGDLQTLDAEARAAGTLLTVGFNRRFAPLAERAAHAARARSGPLAVSMIVNAGKLPREHWTRDRAVGGGRLTGEGCHFIDLARFLVGAPVAAMQVVAARDDRGHALDDIATVSLSYADGSIATIQYLANGSNAFPKERIDLFFDSRTLTIDNWRRLITHGASWRPQLGGKQDKGHLALQRAWLAAIAGGGGPPIAYDELFETSRLSIQAGA
jgi:predicted dehydrogenase/NADPH:quinone reductase-like Zn-dependent oxidoreductase